MEQQIKDILGVIDKAVADFQSKMPSIQKDLFDELLNLIKELDTKDGKLLNSLGNLRLIGQIKNSLKKIILKSDYKKEVENFIDHFDTISKLNAQYFSLFNDKYTPPKTLGIIKDLAVESTLIDLIGQGMEANILEPVKKILMQNITGGGSYSKMQDILRDYFVSTPESAGKLENYTKQITTDAINQYNAQYHDTIAQNLSFNWGQYVGSLIATSREFCELLTQKRWVHRSELKEIIKGHIDNKKCKLSKSTGLPLGMIPGTNEQNFKILRGGYNCGHQFFWVPDNVVPVALRNKFKIVA